MSWERAQFSHSRIRLRMRAFYFRPTSCVFVQRRKMLKEYSRPSIGNSVGSGKNGTATNGSTGTQRQLWIFSAMARRKMEELNRRGVREYRTRVWFNYNYVRYVFVIALVHFPLPFPYNLIFSFLCVSVMRTIMCIYHLAWTGHRQWSMPFISGRLRASASGIIFSCTGVGRNLLVLTCQITRIAFCRGCSNCSLLTSITRIDVSVSLWCIACMHWILLTTYSLCSQPIHWY